MSGKAVGLLLIVAAVGAGLWIGRDHCATLDYVTHAVGLPGGDSTPATGPALAAVGVHKCQTAAGVTYSDRPCAKGVRELAANGGTVTVMSFPKAAPPPEVGASGGPGLIGSPIVKGFTPEQVDRLREKAIDDAANR